MAEPWLRRITVAVDGSTHGAAALAAANDLAVRYGADLVILSVAPFVPAYVGPNDPFVAPTPVAAATDRFREVVEAAVKQAEAAGVTNVTGVCEEGVIVDEILDHLEQHPTDLLVVGSRGLSATRRLLLGSVSTALVNHAPCPVLVVRPTAATKPAG
jgi:nucleotide-binding universal stress UspA family protein